MLINLASTLAPRLSDRFMARAMPYLQRSHDPAGPRERNNLYAPQDDLKERSNYPFPLKSSLYTQANLHPLAALAVAAGALALTAGALRARQRF